MLLTCAVGVGIETVENGYEIDKISEHLDFINLMTYDLHGPWETKLGHNAPLKARLDDDEKDKKLNLEFVVDYWLSKGAPKEKLILGVATYGRSFRLGQSFKNSPGDVSVGKGRSGRFSGEAGFLTYYEICQNINKENWALKFDEIQKVPYSYSNKHWVSFDDVKSVEIKVTLLHNCIREINL